ncbi:MAG: ABC transporter ATP-binding protein [Oscillochloridaceae bacterium]|nr:ABC transporter ATP-binding protein [Chloroflexaceae bacterium]MDW8390023.1 ABC transporter ATP-binding protein [Oscillochloridaceae bacterium]
MSNVIEIEELHKAYGSLPVLQALNLRVAAGEVYGLLGPNGAGKTTLIHLMMGFLRPNQGRLRLLGSANLERVRPRIGYIPERQRYHTRYTAREYLRFLGQFSGLSGVTLRERVERELATVGLLAAADRSLGTYSKGMLQRLGVAQALLSDPDLLLIDEPTSGLDLAGQREVIELLASVRDRGHTIFLCTHYLQEVELLCDRVGVLAGGRIAAEARMCDLRDVANSVRIRVSELDPELQAQLESLGGNVRCDAQGVRLSPNTPALQATVLRMLLDADVTIMALEPLESPLERLYLWALHSAPPTSAEARGVLPPSLGPDALVAPPAPPPPANERPGESDTLLRELLGRSETNRETDSRR